MTRTDLSVAPSISEHLALSSQSTLPSTSATLHTHQHLSVTPSLPLIPSSANHSGYPVFPNAADMAHTDPGHISMFAGAEDVVISRSSFNVAGRDINIFHRTYSFIVKRRYVSLRLVNLQKLQHRMVRSTFYLIFALLLIFSIQWLWTIKDDMFPTSHNHVIMRCSPGRRNIWRNYGVTLHSGTRPVPKGVSFFMGWEVLARLRYA